MSTESHKPMEYFSNTDPLYDSIDTSKQDYWGVKNKSEDLKKRGIRADAKTTKESDKI